MKIENRKEVRNTLHRRTKSVRLTQKSIFIQGYMYSKIV